MSQEVDVSLYIEEIVSRALDRPPSMTFVALLLSEHEREIKDRIDEASRHAFMGTRLEPGARLRPMKQLVLRLAQLFSREQITFNQAVVAALRGLERQAEQERGPLLDLARQIDRRVEEVHRDLQDLRRIWTWLRQELHLQRSRVDAFLEEAHRRLPGPIDEREARGLVRQLDQRIDLLYAEFEDVFRGTREEVRERQKVYLKDVASLRGGSGPVLDLGCGRCEWLELLRDEGIPAYGVDSSDRFVELGQSLGVEIRRGDALEHLRGVPEGSLGAVTAFHLVEHLDLSALVSLVEASLRALAPGGVLILETPNPTNVNVGSASFYLDPTHDRPLHPLLLQFLVRTRGFGEVELRYLQRPEPPFSAPTGDGEHAESLRAIAGYLTEKFFSAPDYAVVARKVPEPR